MLKPRHLIGLLILTFAIPLSLAAQTVLSGEVIDKLTGDPLIGAYVEVEGTTDGTTTEWDGSFQFNTDKSDGIVLLISYIGYEDFRMEVVNPGEKIKAIMAESSLVIEAVEVKGQRISDKQKSAPLTVESLDLISIKETPAENFYDGLGSLKDVDLTAASLGFKIINTRGFNSTSPVRTLQLIDGIDNQSPGLNFSLGNFLGSSELDVLKVDIIQGATTAFYGPNAFNGVIYMQTKDPFFQKGLAAKLKVGERNLIGTDFRYADAVSNADGKDWLAYKVNFSYLTADDWVADNYAAVDGAEFLEDNPGGYDAVNRYGDEPFRGNSSSSRTRPGFGSVFRTGYNEEDLVDYGTENIKLSGAVHMRLNPEIEFESPELVLSSSFGGGTTVYQGDNRFSLRDIKFFQHRVELRKKNKYFFRAYATHEDAGNSYDPYFTALQLQDRAVSIDDWLKNYRNEWSRNDGRLEAVEGFPVWFDYIDNGNPEDYDGDLDVFLAENRDLVLELHELAREKADSRGLFANEQARFVPGTPEFQEAFDDITSRIAGEEGGTRFYDKSALVHAQGEYDFNPIEFNTESNPTSLDLKAGASGRIYLPDSRGSILLDTMGRNIDTWEFGVYGGATYTFNQNRMKLSASARYDQHENFDANFSPAVSWTFTPSENNFLRVSFSSAIRNPTLNDQYLNYNVGPAILRGNIDGIDSLVTVESAIDFNNTRDLEVLDYFDVAPITTEKVRTLEIGYRTTLFESLYLDAGYYYSRYQDFIGYELGVDLEISPIITIQSADVFRVASNAQEVVTTQGFSIGASYYFAKKYQLRGNYSWNRLNTDTDDPIIPAFNTPEHKYNIGLSGRDVAINLGSVSLPNFGFNINYKWIQGFLFEGSPQFTGLIPTYDLLDAQINYNIKKINTTLKIGATNILNEANFQTYGGPRIGRMAYISLTYDWLKR